MINSPMINTDESFYKKTLKIIIPIALQNLIFSSLNMVDTLMIGQLGETSIAGVGFANQFFFVLTLLFFGIGGGSSVFTSQFYGAKNMEKIKNILGTAIKVAIIAGAIFTLLGLLIPETIIGLFTKEQAVINLGAGYLKIVCLCYIFSGVSFVFTGTLRTIGHVKLPTVVSLISLSLNTLLNYLLIFGTFGFPKLGVTGAAIATLTSRLVEFFLLLTIMIIKKLPIVKLKLHHFTLKGDLKRKYYKTLMPVITNETMWALGTAAYSAIYGRIGTDSAVAYQIQYTITSMFLIFVYGCANASGILTGIKLGENNVDDAYNYGKRFIWLSILLGAATGLLIVFIAPLFIPLFNIKESVTYTAKVLMYIFAGILTFKSLSITMVVGILRSGGDTKVAMLMDIIAVWGVGIPLGLITAFIFKLPITIVYPFICIEEILKGVYGIYRFKSKKWINNLTLGD